ncbi:hypothetical protein LIER_25411 [Lithospermum erythrorhizon]|uniref:Uncharacterized protein n=1 Tax=Lithospermum erythrorhizon TaxID=34254 RepID=A0AAV3R629_LITER
MPMGNDAVVNRSEDIADANNEEVPTDNSEDRPLAQYCELQRQSGVLRTNIRKPVKFFPSGRKPKAGKGKKHKKLSSC